MAVWQGVSGEPSPSAGPADRPALIDAGTGPHGPRFVAYQLAGKIRCATCVRIEELSRALFFERFASELDAGRFAVRTVNTDLPENRHFLFDFDLASSALVLAEVEAGKVVHWKNLAEVWTTVEDEARFREYVASETRAFMEAR